MNVKNNIRRRTSQEKIERAFVELLQTHEIKEIAKVKDSLADWSGIAEQFNKLEEKGAFAGASESKASGSKELTSAELANLNKMSSGTPFSV